MKAVKPLSIAICIFFNSHVFSSEYEDYLFYTSDLNISSANSITLQDVYDKKQAKILLPVESHCLFNVNDMMLYLLSIKSIDVNYSPQGCHIVSGQWVANDGNTYSNSDDLTAIPMWDHEMISRYTDYDDNQSKEALLTKLYSPENWMIIPTKYVQSISKFFPINLDSNDVTSCGDLKKFTLFGMTNGLRFPRELTDKIISLEKYPECESFLSLTRESSISLMSESWEKSLMHLKSLTGD